MNQQEWSRYKAQFQVLQPGLATVAVIAFDVLALLAAWKMRGEGLVLGLLSILLLALVLLHAYLLLHEATHSAISNNRRVNDWVGHISGWLILMPFYPRQRSHLLHHMWTGHPQGDPANKRIIQRFSVMTQEQAESLERIWRNWLPLITLNDRIGLWRDAFQQRSRGAKSRRFGQEIRSIYANWVGYGVLLVVLAYFGALGSIVSWYLPALIIQFLLEELANLPHHAQTPLLDENDKALPYWEQPKVTHSCKSLPIWSRFVLLNFNLHTAHHLFPWVPWSGLPAVHREIAKHYPDLEQDQQSRNELAWSLTNRKRPLLEIMGHYINKIPNKA